MQNKKPKSEAAPVRDILMDLHLEFLNIVKIDHERELKRTLGPVEWFQILVASPDFRWLSPFNSILADVDALVAGPITDEEDLIIVRSELERILFQPSEGTSDLVPRLLDALVRNAKLRDLYDNLRNELKKLPEGTVSQNSETHRKRWHERASSIKRSGRSGNQ